MYWIEPDCVNYICDPQLLKQFKQSLHDIDSTQGLLKCAFLVARHADEDAQFGFIEQEITRLVDKIQLATSDLPASERLCQVHKILFQEEQYGGCAAHHYHHPINAYLPFVVHAKQGLPTLLCLIYKAVCERVGLPVEGLNVQGRFLVRVRVENNWLIVDPFDRGRCLNLDSACGLINRLIGGNLAPRWECFPIATNAQWLYRILRNLTLISQELRFTQDAHAYEELQACISADLLHDCHEVNIHRENAG